MRLPLPAIPVSVLLCALSLCALSLCAVPAAVAQEAPLPEASMPDAPATVPATQTAPAPASTPTTTPTTAPASVPAETPATAPAAQTTPAAKSAPAAEPVPVSPLELDIRTSTLVELAAWCRELGLSEGGTKEELAGRLRKHFQLSEPAVPTAKDSKDSGRTVVVESARSTEYFTLEAVDEEYARLRGDVVITMKDGESTHRIQG